MKKLYLSRNDKKIAGVAGGLAEYLDIDPTVIRILWIVVTIFTAFIPGVITYLLMAVVMPAAPAK